MTEHCDATFRVPAATISLPISAESAFPVNNDAAVIVVQPEDDVIYVTR